MKKLLILSFIFLVSCSLNFSSDDRYMWMENDDKQLAAWLQKQDENYIKFKSNYEDTSLFFKKQNEEVKSDSLVLNLKTTIGNYFFYEAQDGIYYQHDEETEKPTLFLSSDALQFEPKLLETNFSNYLIIKGSRFLNDEVALQVWDIENKQLIADFIIYDFPKAQATSKFLYFFEADDEGKTVLKKFDFEKQTIDLLDLKSKFSLQVINSSSLITQLKNEFYLYTDQTEKDEPKTIDFENEFDFFGASDETLFFYDNQMDFTAFYSYDLQNDKVKEIFKMDKKISIEKCILNNGFIYFSFIEKGKSNLFSFDIHNHNYKPIFRNELARIQFKKYTETSIKIDYTSFHIPNISYELKADSSLVKITENLTPELSNFKIEQKWVKNQSDSIPMIFYYKDSLLNSNSPLLLHVYGGFKQSVMPAYSEHINLFVQNGGVYAIAGVRGGGENGISWHTSATLENKKNSFADFGKCLDFISEHKISKPKKIGIYGFSNGGLIINDAILNHSEKFKVAVSIFGLSDMVNFDKYDQPKWYNEFGYPKNRSIKKYLKTYSPLHQLKKISNQNLEVLLITGDKDDRVSPFNSYKFVHGLQEFENEAYLKVFQDVGHHFKGEKLNQLYDEAYSFMLYNLET
ncbi:prolyl oligopeptidase family serine peptidase [Psychroflexus planctonicus]|uniref:prolyl oligopeptidase n=1 Tax=Psychroflexus planctonicus TaxID=1526575 RepID=A0ABQ1SIB3_9FLAO|nr:prolyl oligopeptidase family serine peptidase [Psychroflexus planctonicus]GGE35532.1 prolyl endopeptidase [Psychroflexus planctonicus]